MKTLCDSVPSVVIHFSQRRYVAKESLPRTGYTGSTPDIFLLVSQVKARREILDFLVASLHFKTLSSSLAEIPFYLHSGLRDLVVK